MLKNLRNNDFFSRGVFSADIELFIITYLKEDAHPFLR
jgi:hypothetical protein